MQALREAEIESREDVERARIASERALDGSASITRRFAAAWRSTARKRSRPCRWKRPSRSTRIAGGECRPRRGGRRARPVRPRQRKRSRPSARPRLQIAASRSDVDHGGEGRSRGPAYGPGAQVRAAVEAEAAKLLNEAETFARRGAPFAVHAQDAGACGGHCRSLGQAARKDPGHQHHAALPAWAAKAAVQAAVRHDEVINSALRYASRRR